MNKFKGKKMLNPQDKEFVKFHIHCGKFQTRKYRII